MTLGGALSNHSSNFWTFPRFANGWVSPIVRDIAGFSSVRRVAVPVERVLRLFPVVLLVLPCEVATTGESDGRCDGSDPLQLDCLVKALTQQQLPNLVHAHGSMQL